MFHNQILLFVVWLIDDWEWTLEYSEIIVHWMHILFQGLVKMQPNNFDQSFVSEEKKHQMIFNNEFHTNSGRLGLIMN
jgi:hypothetical protein